MSRSQTLLKIESVSKSFGKMKAVRQFSTEIKRGEVTSVIGQNGAGKTTLFNVITGKHKPDEGRVLFKNANITGMSPNEVCYRGIGRAFQISSIFPEFTVFENIQISLLSRLKKTRNMFEKAEKIGEIECIELVKMLDLTENMKVKAGLLSHGDQKRLDIGITLASKPELLLLDEPTAGMGTEETKSAKEFVQRLSKEQGMTVLLIEHDMDVVFDISSSIIVMHEGGLLERGTPEAIRSSKTVKRIYLGEKS